MENPNQLGSQ
ncbi:hypothetical protein CISIN_1g0095802mg, partial [Citrus sinensis]